MQPQLFKPTAPARVRHRRRSRLFQIKDIHAHRAVRCTHTWNDRRRPRGAITRQAPGMAKKFPLHPKHPERICWGCDRYCPTDSMACGNGSGRTMHPAEMLGDDWYTVGDWGFDDGDDNARGPVPVQAAAPPSTH